MSPTTRRLGESELLGTDWEFPMKADGCGRLARISGADNLEQAIIAWLEDSQGEILYEWTKGLGIEKYIFRDLDEVAAQAPPEIERSLIAWEPRLSRIEVSAVAAPLERTVRLYIEYESIAYRIAGNFTYALQMKE